jgi:hypothetical protein
MRFANLRSRLTHRRKLVLFILFVIMVAITVPILVNYWAEAEWRKVLAETDRLDPGWRWEQLEAKRSAVPDDENAALVILDIEKLVEILSRPDAGELFESLSDLAQHPNYRMRPEQFENVRQLLGQYQKALPHVYRLGSISTGRFPIPSPIKGMDFIVTHTESARRAAAAIRFDSLARIESGDVDGVHRCILSAIGVLRAFGDDYRSGIMIDRLQCLGIPIVRFLAQLQFSDDQLKIIQQLLSDEEKKPHLLGLARSDRALFLIGLEEAKLAEGGPAFSWSIQGWLQSVKNIIAGPKTDYSIEEHLRALNNIVEFAKKPEPQCYLELENYSKMLAGKAVSFFVVSFIQKIELLRIYQARLRCYIVAIAAERYRLENQAWPNNLQDLVTSGFLIKVPTDPFDGNDLRWKQCADGWQVYSIGVDRMDNDGIPDREMRGKDNTDIVVPLFDLNKRRLPPLPEQTEPPKN